MTKEINTDKISEAIESIREIQSQIDDLNKVLFKIKYENWRKLELKEKEMIINENINTKKCR